MGEEGKEEEREKTGKERRGSKRRFFFNLSPGY